MAADDRPSEASDFIEREVQSLIAILARENDFVPDTLRFHLVVESQLDRIIEALLPGGRKLVAKGGLRFRQKLAVVEALAGKQAAVFICLSKLNALRNQCAHDRDKVITTRDLDKIGMPLGEEYLALKAEHADDLGDLAATTFSAVFGNLSAWVYRVEHPSTLQ